MAHTYRFVMTRHWPEMATLELLSCIDDRGSLGAASRALGMSQPNASRAIRQLEHRLGMALVERSPRGSTLTAHGTVIVHWARQVLADMESLVEAAAALRVEREAQLTIASSMTVAEYLLPGWLGGFRALNTDVQFHLRVLN